MRKKELLVVLVLFSEEYGERENNNYGHYLIINQTWKYVCQSYHGNGE